MKATLLLVTFGVLLQVSWGAVVAVGDSVRRPDPPGPSDPKDTKGQLQDDSKEIGEQLVLDDKSKVLQYSILGDAGDAENCGYTQEELVPQEVTLDIASVESTGQDNPLLFTIELSLPSCAREKVTHLILAANLTALVRTKNHQIRIIRKTCIQHSVLVDGLIGKRVRFQFLVAQQPLDILAGVYRGFAAMVDKDGGLHRAPPATKAALRI